MIILDKAYQAERDAGGRKDQAKDNLIDKAYSNPG